MLLFSPPLHLTSPSLPPLPPKPPPTPPFFFLLFYLRSLSEGLTISSSVSLLSCRAVNCLWFVHAHPCGCSFRQPSVTCWIGGVALRGPGPHSFSSPEMGPTPVLVTWLVGVEEATGCETWTLFSCRRLLSFRGTGIRAIEILLERKRKDRRASSLCSQV